MTRDTRGNSGNMVTVAWQWMGRKTPTYPTVPSWTTTMLTNQSSWWTLEQEPKSMGLLSLLGKERDKVGCLVHFDLHLTSHVAGKNFGIEIF